MNENDDIEYVEAELVEPEPEIPTPALKFALSAELPNNPVRAPQPESLFHRKRPGPKRKYASPAQMKEVIDKYFADCVRIVPNEISGEHEFYWIDPPTVPGLARALGMTSKTLLEYQKLDEFAEIIADAKLVIEEYYAKALATAPKAAANHIFMLKNFGWQDNRTVTYAPPTRLEAAKTPEQLAELIEQDIVD